MNNRKTSHHETTLIETRMTSHRCQSKAGVSIKALILLSSSALLGGGASWTGLLDWTGKTSGIAYKSFPNSSHSESSGYKANQFNKLLHLHTKNWYTTKQEIQIPHNAMQSKAKQCLHILKQITRLQEIHFLLLEHPQTYFLPLVCSSKQKNQS